MRIQEVRCVEFQTGAGSWTASPKELKEFIAAYQRAGTIRDDIGTTPEVRAEVILVSGERLVIWGGGESFQTLAFRGRQLNLQGDELRALFLRLARVEQGGGAANGSQPIRSETNRTSSAAGFRR